MAGANLSGILAIVVEVLVLEDPVLVANQPIGADGVRIELNLDLHVLGDGHERRARFLHEHAMRLVDRIEVGVVPIALVRQLLHRRVFQVAGTDAEDREKHAALPLALDQPHQVVLIDHADVEVAVGGEDHAIDAALEELLARGLIREANARAAVGRAARLQLGDRPVDRFFLVAGGRRQHQAAGARIDDDRHAIARIERVGEHPHAALHQR